MDDVRPAQHGRVQPAGGRLDDGARAHVAHGVEHRLDRQLPRHDLPPSRSWDVSHAVAPVHLGLDFTSLLMLWAFPSFVSALSLLIADRAFGTVFFTSPQGGSLLWDHMFWFFGHPEVYVLLLPGFAIVGDLFSTFSRRPLYAKKIIIPCFA